MESYSGQNKYAGRRQLLNFPGPTRGAYLYYGRSRSAQLGHEGGTTDLEPGQASEYQAQEKHGCRPVRAPTASPNVSYCTSPGGAADLSGLHVPVITQYLQHGNVLHPSIPLRNKHRPAYMTKARRHTVRDNCELHQHGHQAGPRKAEDESSMSPAFPTSILFS